LQPPLRAITDFAVFLYYRDLWRFASCFRRKSGLQGTTLLIKDNVFPQEPTR